MSTTPAETLSEPRAPGAPAELSATIRRLTDLAARGSCRCSTLRPRFSVRR